LIDLANPKIYYIEIPKKQNQSTVLNQENWNIKDILKKVKNTFSWEENSFEESKTSIKLVWLLPTILVFIFWIWLIIIRYKLWQDLTKAWKEVVGWIWFSFILWSFFIIKWIFKR
jgi:ATP-dependent Zn protease